MLRALEPAFPVSHAHRSLVLVAAVARPMLFGPHGWNEIRVATTAPIGHLAPSEVFWRRLQEDNGYKGAPEFPCLDPEGVVKLVEQSC